MYIIFIVPLAIAIIAYLALQVYIRIKRSSQHLVNTVVSPDGRNFSLYMGFESPGVTAWHAYELEGNGNGASGNTREVTRMRLLFILRFMDMLDPNEQGIITIYGNKYLLLERDGIYFSLYDIEADRSLVHESDPQAEYSAWAEKESSAKAFNEEAYLVWVKEHLHSPIAAILEGENS